MSSGSERKFLVVIAWEEFPNCGAYTEAVIANDHDHAEEIVRRRMAEHRVNDGIFETVEDALDSWGDEWELCSLIELNSDWSIPR